MQISSKEVLFFITLTTGIFLIAPIFLIIYISLYNKKKARHLEEKESLKKTFEMELLKSQFEVQEQVMEKIATNLHDNIGQLLSLTSITLSSISMESVQQQKIITAGDLVVRAIQELRQLSKMMSGQELMNKNLAHAIAYEIEWLKKAAEYEIRFSDDTSHSIAENAGKELILFRIFQEILSNIIRHAQASVISIVITQTPTDLSLRVTDNGRGFVTQEKLEEQSGMGLFNMSKRATMMEGIFTIVSNPGFGTEIFVSIPYI